MKDWWLQLRSTLTQAEWGRGRGSGSQQLDCSNAAQAWMSTSVPCMSKGEQGVGGGWVFIPRSGEPEVCISFSFLFLTH